MLTGCVVHATNSMKSGDGEHDQRSWTRLDTMRQHKVDGPGVTIRSSLVDDQFPTPIGPPLLMKVGDDRDPSPQRSTAFYETTLIRIVMSQETVAGGIRIVIESHMTPDDIRERFDMVTYAGEL